MTTATEELRDLAEKASAELADASAAEALEWTARTFGDSWILASNMQDAVLIDLAAKAKPDFDVLFLQTGYHFPETIGLRDAVAATYSGINVVNALPDKTVAEQDAEEGPDLWQRAPDRCCAMRKVVPLRRTLANYDAWVTGVRRVDAPTRADTPIVQWDDRNGLVKINPIAPWTDEEFREYIDRNGILENLLVAEGYLSIGCAPCTAKVAPGADPRSGRWAGQSKTECGLHG
ncbi:phosphoadenylyl-sulfate reductase [Kibdelosporangium phytohabitans]|uniref:Adenosine 5'-phosphosulfate reductase n=1 Tax=Kibdelosporangium phytohabitans TaxID=860235 RepID=A0A0N9HVE5_9PSEU|nr:phosphoadenylyl-sulfate reductase [Kibdelosporangium phytohabitans]ALG07534.1 phosphoadenosine phosphosulfate reductase [Kibdelosporangium phytohabitans]MBE1471544.1 phosphoadenosine phosphosulfate reductase [Kibdelosporangium phytohabitans]